MSHRATIRPRPQRRYHAGVDGTGIEAAAGKEAVAEAAEMPAEVVMVAIVIAFPYMVTHYKGKPIDMSNVKIEIPKMPGLGAPGTLGSGGLGTPNFGILTPAPKGN